MTNSMRIPRAVQLFFVTILGISMDAVDADELAPGYLQDPAAAIVRSGFGTCWRAGSWTMANAVIGCDGVLQSPVSKITAPPLLVVVPTEEPATPAPMSAPAPAPPRRERCDYSMTLAGDDTFEFNTTSLKPQAKAHIDAQLIEPLNACVTDRVAISGHADRIGAASYNQHLSEKRAATVATYLKEHGVQASFELRGAGSNEPVTNCGRNMSLNSSIACLAPNRRVVIQTFGIRTK